MIKDFAENYMEKLFYFCLKKTGNNQAAEDLTQDVFVKLTKNIHSYVPTASFSAYLYRIAHNRVVDYYRTAKPSEEIPETKAAPDKLASVDAKLDVYAVLSALPPEQRECIILYYLQELTYREISQILDIPIPTAKSRVQRGLAACKKMMEEKT